MKPGNINKLKVLRKTDLGYMLQKGNEEVFLHNNETNYKELENNEFVDAFLYYDFKNRLSATLYEPLIEEGQKRFLKVVGVNPGLGVFVDMGINKDLLVSKDELPNNKNRWPKVNDMLYVTLVVKGRLVGDIVKPSEIDKKVINVKEKDKLDGYIIEITNSGLNVLTEDLDLVFVHHTQLRRNYRIGELVTVTVIRVYEHTINGTLILQKEDMIDVDAEMILNYLKVHKRSRLTNSSTPEEIKAIFPMSKKAFKRAIGNLYRRDLITFTDEYTIYIGDDDE